MTIQNVTIQGELRPEWLLKIVEALTLAESEGWVSNGPIEFLGNPYVWKEELKFSKWTI